jgi:ATP-binding cassette subfamily B protein
MKRNWATLVQFWSFLQQDRRILVGSLFLMMLTLVFDLARPYLMNDALGAIGAGDWSVTRQTSLWFLFLVILEYLTRSLYSYLVSWVFLRGIHRLRLAVFRHTLSLRQRFFDRQPVGKVLTKVVNDAESLAETLRAGVVNVVVDLLTIAGILVVMATIDLRLMPVMILAVPLVMLMVRWSGKKLKENYHQVRKKLAASNAIMAEGLMGVEVLQVFQAESREFRKFQTINRGYLWATIWNNVYDITLYAVIDTLGALVTAGLIYWAFGFDFGWVEVTSVIVFVSLVERVFVPIRDLSNKFTTIQQAAAALERIFSLLNHGDVMVSGGEALPEGELSIAFDGVTFSYQEGQDPVLDGVSFDVAPGTVCALVGKTGSGKSTIGKLLSRTYDGYQGSIRLGGKELADLALTDIYRRIAVVHQDVELFPGTIRQNIALFDDSVADEAILETIEKVKAQSVFDRFPQGLETPIVENGKNLSQGQRQLVVFARALLWDAPILLMDEATANVDSRTEQWIQEAIAETFARKTVIVVAHRLSTIRHADLILVLEKGRIVERGNHQTLNKPFSRYREFIEAQQAQQGGVA